LVTASSVIGNRGAIRRPSKIKGREMERERERMAS
jgi:hypothetical protein